MAVQLVSIEYQNLQDTISHASQFRYHHSSPLADYLTDNFFFLEKRMSSSISWTDSILFIYLSC